MGKLINEWVKESILTEDINKTVVTYVGRFHPFHSGHYATYQHLVKKFGKDNVYIGTSDKVQLPKSPFQFKEKVQIMTTMFGIPKDKIVKVKNPYAPKEILQSFPEETTAFITVVGEKDKNRLGGKYFEPYKGKVEKGFADAGYVYVAPSQARGISGTEVRKGMSNPNEQSRIKFFKSVYPKFNQKIFDLVSSRILRNEEVMESFFKSIDFKSLLEASLYGADAGEPDTMYVPAGQTRILGTQNSSQKDEPWMDSMGYTQMHFPKADSIYSKDSKGTSDEAEYYAIKKIKKNPALQDPIESDDFVTTDIGKKGVDLHTVNENSTAAGIGGNSQGVDDGPGAFYGNMKTFKKEMEDVVGTLGWNIVTYLMGEDDMESFVDTEYPNGPGRYPVSFFPSGKAGLDALAVRYGDDLQGNKAYKKWADHIKGVALQLGYEFLNFLEPNDKENILSNEPKKEEETTGDLKEGVLLEGGAYGHMNHPFDVDLGLTFGDLKLIIDGALNGKLEFTREKTDGQALAISYRKDRGIIAARNKSHLKDRGLNALDIKGVSDKFANRGGLTNAYNFAMRDLESAISKLSDAQKEKVFKNGSKFMNIEVIWPESVNVIPYGQPLLVFHGTMEYNEKGEAIGADTSDARILAGMIKQVNADVQDKYTIQGPPIVQLPQNQELSKLKSKFFGQLSKIQKEFKLKDTDGVAEYHQRWWEDFVEKNSPTSLDNKTKMGLVRRWAFYDTGFRLDSKNISDSKTLDWAKKTDKIDQAKISKQNLRKFEDIFLGVGAEVLSFMSSVLTVQPEQAVRDMKKRLDQTIKDVQKSGDPKKIDKLKMELERLKAVGGKDKLVPNEGLVFLYKGHTMKLTGTFASLNQILGLMYF